MFCFKSIQRLQQSSCGTAGPSEVRDFVTFLCTSYTSSVIMNFLLTDPTIRIACDAAGTRFSRNYWLPGCICGIFPG